MATLTLEEVQKLNYRLPRGWMVEARKRLAAQGHLFWPSRISDVKNGKVDNDLIVDMLLTIAEEEEAKKAARRERILGAPAVSPSTPTQDNTFNS